MIPVGLGNEPRWLEVTSITSMINRTCEIPRGTFLTCETMKSPNLYLRLVHRGFRACYPVLRCLMLLVCAGIASAQEDFPRKLSVNHLPNPIEVQAGVVSGGLPESQQAFEELKQLGVRTIISVDGAKPNVTMAERYSMRYVHIPHGYDGIPESTLEAISKAIRELPGPIYIHCHHGKHRSPAATAAACVSLGLIENDDALEVLKLAGTSRAYKGLFQAVQNARQFDTAYLDKLSIEFPSQCEVPPLVDAMVALEETYSKLDRVATAEWKSKPEIQAMDPAHEAVLLREHFEEMRRLEDVARFPDSFQRMLQESEQAALFIESMLNPSVAENPFGNEKNPKERAGLSRLKPIHRKAMEINWNTIRSNCAACHRQFRDKPN